jgi:hypothetical protein
MTGYQEILTDPSYRGQIVTMTYPQIGNYGVNDEDDESDGPKVEGFVVRDASRQHSNWRSRKDLHQYLKENGVAVLAVEISMEENLGLESFRTRMEAFRELIDASSSPATGGECRDRE